MYSYGYRAQQENAHKISVDFAGAIFGKKYKEYINTFDRMRRKRHTTVYEETGIITEYHAKFAIKTAKEFLDLVKIKIKDKLK